MSEPDDLGFEQNLWLALTGYAQAAVAPSHDHALIRTRLLDPALSASEALMSIESVTPQAQAIKRAPSTCDFGFENATQMREEFMHTDQAPSNDSIPAMADPPAAAVGQDKNVFEDMVEISNHLDGLNGSQSRQMGQSVNETQLTNDVLNYQEGIFGTQTQLMGQNPGSSPPFIVPPAPPMFDRLMQIGDQLGRYVGASRVLAEDDLVGVIDQYLNSTGMRLRFVYQYMIRRVARIRREATIPLPLAAQSTVQMPDGSIIYGHMPILRHAVYSLNWHANGNNISMRIMQYLAQQKPDFTLNDMANTVTEYLGWSNLHTITHLQRALVTEECIQIAAQSRHECRPGSTISETGMGIFTRAMGKVPVGASISDYHLAQELERIHPEADETRLIPHKMLFFDHARKCRDLHEANKEMMAQYAAPMTKEQDMSSPRAMTLQQPPYMAQQRASAYGQSTSANINGNANRTNFNVQYNQTNFNFRGGSNGYPGLSL